MEIEDKQIEYLKEARKGLPQPYFSYVETEIRRLAKLTRLKLIQVQERKENVRFNSNK